MSEFLAVQPGSKPAGVWQAGRHLRVTVSRELGDNIRTVAQTAIDNYAPLVDGAITGVAELVDDDLHRLGRPDELTPFTIAVRLSPGSCPFNAGGCANKGPEPLGPNASIVNLSSTGVTGTTVGHELGARVWAGPPSETYGRSA